ncbi:MAG: cyclic nucleotide-binding domain-containing protein [Candidatus Sulfomarinibacteraceae bacterium]
MNDRLSAYERSSRTIRILSIVSLSLTLVAMLSGLLFVHRTTGGTLFLFSLVAPIFVISAITIYAVTQILEFRQKHKLFKIETYPAGWTVFRQGDPADSAYFIRSGEVEVVDEDTGSVIRSLGSGDYFGEIALIANAPRSATIRTVSEVELAVLGKRNFLNMMRLLPTTEEAILHTVQERATHDAMTKKASRSRA